MLLWQRKNLPKITFGAQLAGIIVLMHAVALLLLCVHSVAVHDELSIDLSQSYLIGADIIVVPFQKTIKQPAVAALKPIVQQVKRDTTVIKDVKAIQSKPESAKSAPLSKEAVKEAAPEIAKKIEPVVPKPEAPNIEKQEATQAPIAQHLPAKSIAPVAQSAPHYIGTRQLQTMKIQQAIVEQVQMHWAPPEGLEPELEVILSIHIGMNGDVTDIDTQQSSGVFAYDVHARSAVYEMAFPKVCWGKTITIAFK